MYKNLPRLLTFFVLAPGFACAAPTYREDVAFLRQHVEIIELSNGDARVAVAPAYQGRVMSSTTSFSDGTGFGWINPEVIAAGIKPEAERTGLAKHIHVFGGEERLWFGPEGGPFSLFFPSGVQQTFANWKTPAPIDTEPFEIVGQPAPGSVSLAKSFRLPNRSGTVLSIDVRRTVTLMPGPSLTSLPGIRSVGYTTANTVKNTGDRAWSRETGAPSIWLLGMFKPTPGTTIVIPFTPGDESTLGPRANTTYFGRIPDTRIKFSDRALFFKADGTERGKLGLTPKRAMGVAGSWQKDTATLTLVRIVPQAQNPGANWPYVDSQWRDDVDPFGGDVINAYNDGPPEPGAKPLGPFYELETSSPALFLQPGESYTHVQSTAHFTGARDSLDRLARESLGVSLDEIEQALP